MEIHMETFMRLRLPRFQVFSRSLFSCKGRFVFFFVSVLGLSPPLVHAQTHPAEIIMKNMISAIESGSLTDFVASGDPAFRSGITQEVFNSIQQTLAPRLKQGYTAKFLTSLNQQGFTVYLWKLEFKDNNDDVLATLAMKDGKVSGFWLR
jgi:hypothetical protein